MSDLCVRKSAYMRMYVFYAGMCVDYVSVYVYVCMMFVHCILCQGLTK